MDLKKSFKFRWQNWQASRLADSYSIGDSYKRIYLYHVRKTGGTSLNHMFLSLGDRNARSLYGALINDNRHRVIANSEVFVGWNKHLIEEGKYFYAFSHLPAHELNLPTQTFTVTCLRDPIKRLISHYRMLLEFQQNQYNTPDIELEVQWLGNNFDDFLDKIPMNHLLNQLYMFSPTYNVDEAYEQVTNCSQWLLTEYFSDGVAKLSEKLQLPLEVIHTRKTSIEVEIEAHSIERLREILAPEYELYNKLVATLPR